MGVQVPQFVPLVAATVQVVAPGVIEYPVVVPVHGF